MPLVWQFVRVSITSFKEKFNSGGQGHALEDSFVGLQGMWVGSREKAEWFAKHLGRSEIIRGKLSICSLQRAAHRLCALGPAPSSPVLQYS